MRRSTAPGFGRSRWTLVFLAGLWMAVEAEPGLAQSSPPWPIDFHDLNVRLDPAGAQMAVVDRFRLREPTDRRRALPLLLHRDLRIDSASVDGVPLEVETLDRWRPRDFWPRPDYAALAGYTHTTERRLLAPDGGWPVGENGSVEIEVRYSGAVYDSLHPPEVAYDRGFETTSGLIDPRGAFLSGQTFWVPFSAEDRFTFRLRTELPPPWHSMSQGERTLHRTVDGRNVSVWEETAPQEEIYLIAGPYVVRERAHGEVRLYTYTYADTDSTLCDTYLEAAGRYLDLYGERFGPYPFAKWAMVENWWQTGFGMPSFTLLGDRVIRLPFIVDTSYGHEILHCWWGNGVYVDYAHGNWCEGLTVHGADYLYKRRQSDDAARDYRRSALVAYLDFASSGERDFPLRDFRERSDFGTQAVGYSKSLMVFHMLEQRLGAERFLDGLRLFYRRHLFEPARWDDLATAFSEVADEDLGAWFAQWVDRPGAIVLSAESMPRTEAAVRIRLHQAAPVYDALVPLRWEDPSGAHRRVVRMREADVDVELPASTRRVAVDSDYDLFRRLYREEIPPTLSQALGADSTAVVIGAEESPSMRQSLRSLAEQWAQNQNTRVIDEERVETADLAGRSVFVFGRGPWQRKVAAAAGGFGEEAAALDRRADEDPVSVVYCARDPQDAERAWVVLRASGPEVCNALRRKIPHYSRYSWLVFEGEKNVGKGQWTVRRSPLHLEFDPEAP